MTDKVGITSPERDYWPTEGWRASIPQEQNMDPELLAQMVEIVDDQDIALDSVLVVRGGYLVLEDYWHNYDERTLHHLQSVTKSVTSMLIGAAISNGLIEDVGVNVLDLFP